MPSARNWRDARRLSPGDRLIADVCIVGAGPAGLSVARALADRRRSLILLDSGGDVPDDATQALGKGRLVGRDYFPLQETRQRGLGGSSNHWDVPLGAEGDGARFHPLSPADFGVREWMPHSGWPLDPAGLDSFYRQGSRLCGIEPEEADNAATRRRARPLSLDPGVVETAMFRLGAAYRWRPDRLLAGMDVSGLTVLTYATVVEILVADGAQAVTGVRVLTAPGREFTVTARVVVLAAGGIENARLLLLSKRGRNGLGNERDLVGRYFMEHPWLRAGVLVPVAAGPVPDLGLYQVHRTAQGWAEARLVLTEEVRRKEQIYGCGVRLQQLASDGTQQALEAACAPSSGEAAASLVVSAVRRGVMPRDLGRLLRTIAGDPAGLFAAGRKTGAGPRLELGDRAVCALEVMSEQAPNPDSRVLLDMRRRDALGQPRAKLDWRVSSQDVATIVRTLELIGAEFAARRLGRFHVPLHPHLPSPRLRGGRHHMGTTRMSADPAHGVVDSDCRVHGLRNLYVAGSSVFPTGGYANPTLTVVALALRLGAHLRERLACRATGVRFHSAAKRRSSKVCRTLISSSLIVNGGASPMTSGAMPGTERISPLTPPTGSSLPISNARSASSGACGSASRIRPSPPHAQPLTAAGESSTTRSIISCSPRSTPAI